MAFNAQNILKRYDPQEKEALLDALLADATPKETPESVKPVSLAEIWDEEGDKGFKGLSTGFPSLDELTQGMQPGAVHVYFGDTGHGKSQVTQNIAVQVAETGAPVLFIGLEMTLEENRDRFKDFGATATTPIFLPPAIDLDYKALENNIAADEYSLVIIDHLHMFENQGHENETNFLSAICREVKMLAIKYRVPIILVSHINEDKNRTGPPKLSDLKGSSSIKQIADVAIAVFNEGMTIDIGPKQQELTLILRKNRRGRKRIKAELLILEDAKLAEKRVFVA